jgi:hypothetical protein
MVEFYSLDLALDFRNIDVAAAFAEVMAAVAAA